MHPLFEIISYSDRAVWVARALLELKPNGVDAWDVADEDILRLIPLKRRSLQMAFAELDAMGAAIVERAYGGRRHVAMLPHHVWADVLSFTRELTQ